MIGEINERSLHRALKARYAGAHGVIEQSVDGFVADVVAGGRIVEIQTGGFGPLRNKLTRLVERCTTLDLAAAVQSTRRCGQLAAYCFREGGVTEICGKDGNALVFRRAALPG